MKALVFQLPTSLQGRTQGECPCPIGIFFVVSSDSVIRIADYLRTLRWAVPKAHYLARRATPQSRPLAAKRLRLSLSDDGP